MMLGHHSQAFQGLAVDLATEHDGLGDPQLIGGSSHTLAVFAAYSVALRSRLP
jgi:hypothetical protein